MCCNVLGKYVCGVVSDRRRYVVERMRGISIDKIRYVPCQDRECDAICTTM